MRGGGALHVILVYGDFECPYTRAAYRAIQHVEHKLPDDVEFVFRHFPLIDVHPRALAAAYAAEAASQQDRYWQMHDMLFHRQHALEDPDLRGYAAELGLDVDAFDRDRASAAVTARVQRDVDSAAATGEVFGTPTLFIDGTLYDGATDAESLTAAIR